MNSCKQAIQAAWTRSLVADLQKKNQPQHFSLLQGNIIGIFPGED